MKITMKLELSSCSLFCHFYYNWICVYYFRFVLFSRKEIFTSVVVSVINTNYKQSETLNVNCLDVFRELERSSVSSKDV